MTRLRVAALLLTTAGALSGCAAKLTAAAPAVATRPAMKMTQTDFVIRVVNYSCQTVGCVNVGQRNANLGTPGVRKTIRDMCYQHMNADSSFERAPMTMSCFDKATMSVGDPGLSQIWSECQALNEGHIGFADQCYHQALTELVNQGADHQILAMIPGALTEQPAAAPVAAAPVAPPAPREIGPSCLEWASIVTKCDPDRAPEQVAMITRFSEQVCAAQLPKFKRSRAACLGGAPAPGRGAARAGASGVFLSAAAIEARLSSGLLVTEVVKGSGPHRAGLRAGDVIASVNGTPASLAGWSRAHAAAGLGGTLRVTVKHNGKTEDLEWTVAKCDHESCACGRDGLCSRPGDAPPRQSMSLLMKGAQVEDALEGAGRAAGLQAGDEILRINEIPVRDVQSVIEIVGQLELGAVANVAYARGGKESKVAVKLAAAP